MDTIFKATFGKYTVEVLKEQRGHRVVKSHDSIPMESTNPLGCQDFVVDLAVTWLRGCIEEFRFERTQTALAEEGLIL